MDLQTPATGASPAAFLMASEGAQPATRVRPRLEESIEERMVCNQVEASLRWLRAATGMYGNRAHTAGYVR